MKHATDEQRAIQCLSVACNGMTPGAVRTESGADVYLAHPCHYKMASDVYIGSKKSLVRAKVKTGFDWCTFCK